MKSDDEYNFARDSFAAVEQSRHVLLRSCSRAWRNKLTSWVVAEWDGLTIQRLGREKFEQELRERVKHRVRQRVGFPWLPLALFIAEVIIKILIERWMRSE